MKNFWEKLNKPILALAPMAGVTDSAFRQLCADFGAQVFYSEMASVAALHYAPEKTLEMLNFSKKEKPYVVQLFGDDYKMFAEAVKIIEKKIKPDGIDINFGCPVKKILKQGAGSALMQNLNKSHDVIKATIDNTSLPVSIKTRTKSGDISLDKFLNKIKNLDLKSLMVHGRSLSQGFSGKADWNIADIVKSNFENKFLINGSIYNFKDMQEALKLSVADGVGIGQASFGRPWIFQELKEGRKINLLPEEIFKIAWQHSKLIYKIKGDSGILEMRKHLAWYVKKMPQAKKIRERLLGVDSLEEIEKSLGLKV